MSDRKVVIFETSDVGTEEQLIREYVVPAVPRLEDREDVQWLMFNRYGHDPSVKGGEVIFYIFGDVEAVATDEREHWDGLVTDGFAEEWWTDDTEVSIADFDERELLRHRMRATASRMALYFFEEFDKFPDSTDEFHNGENFGIGWWMCLHHLINQLGYQRRNGEEEIDLLFEDLRNRLYGIATGVSTDHAETKIAELITELESVPPALRDFREERGEHEHQYADRETFEANTTERS
jgi:hypothetical protein